jgi:hypothetical protein
VNRAKQLTEQGFWVREHPRDDDVLIFSTDTVEVDGEFYYRSVGNEWSGPIYNFREEHDCFCDPEVRWSCSGDYFHYDPSKYYIRWNDERWPVMEDLSHLPSPA